MRHDKLHIKLGKLCLPLLLLALCVGQAWGATFPKIEHWDCIPQATITTYNSDGYLYGWDSASNTIVKRMQPDTSYQMTSRQNLTAVDGDYTQIRSINTTAASGVVLAVAGKATNEFDLLRSSDGAANFTKVFDFGEGNGAEGADSTSVTLLDGIAVMTVAYPGGGGIGDLIFGEYNTNASRTEGGENDRIRIMRSTDNGANWTQLVEWNTDETNYVGHVHTIRQDPYTGYVYIAVGDNNNKAALIRWDGSTAWQDNKTPAQLGAIAGFKAVTGSQRHRTVGFAFSSSYVCTFSDTSPLAEGYSTDETGIWYWSKDLATGTRALDTSSYEAQMVGWYGGEASGNLWFTTAMEADAGHNFTTPHLPYYVSSDGGVTWSIAGYVNGQTDDLAVSYYPRAAFTANDKIYRTGASTLDAGYWGTNVLYFTGQTTDTPNQLHPVYYVGTWSAAGSDAASRGQSKWFPTATLNYILTGSRITGGARIRIASGTITDNNSIWAQWGGATLPCASKGIIIEGQGRAVTIVQKTNDGYYLYLDTASGRIYDYPVIIKDLTLINTGATTSSYVVGLYDGAPDLEVYDSNLNGTAVAVINNATVGGTLKTYRTKLTEVATGQNIINNASGKVLNQQHFSSIFVGGQYSATVITSGSVTQFTNCVLYNFATAGIQIYAGADTVPVVKNCIFYGDGSATGIADASGQAEDGTTILNNVFYNCTATGSIANLSATNKTDNNPLFIDAANGDFRLGGGSPAIDAGTPITGLHTSGSSVITGGDAGGNTRLYGSGIDIGAYERPVWVYGPPAKKGLWDSPKFYTVP